MTIQQQPDTLSLSGNLRPFVVSSESDISFSLYKGDTLLLSESYRAGTVKIDLRDIVDGTLSYVINNGEPCYEQSFLAADFHACIDQEVVHFRCVRGGVADLADNAANFLTANFLTWQPVSKAVTYYQPEFLTLYAVQQCCLMIQAFFPDSQSEPVLVASLTADLAYTANMQYAFVSQSYFDGRKPLYYQVWTEDTGGNRLSYIQRYLADRAHSQDEQWFLFENSLGGLDTFRAYGPQESDSRHEHNIADIDGESSEWLVDTERSYTKNTGLLDRYTSRWLRDFFPAKKKYTWHDGALRSIVMTSSQVSSTTDELAATYQFSYRYTSKTALMNLPRQDANIEDIDLQVADLPDFTLPPRLNEFQRVPLSEGALFIVQNPFSENVGVTTAAALFQYVKEHLALPDHFSGYMDLTSYQQASGVKDFLVGIRIRSHVLDFRDGSFTMDAPLQIAGGLTAYADNAQSDSWIDAIPIDNVTLVWDDGVLKAVTGSSFDEDEMWAALSASNSAHTVDPSHIPQLAQQQDQIAAVSQDLSDISGTVSDLETTVEDIQEDISNLDDTYHPKGGRASLPISAEKVISAGGITAYSATDDDSSDILDVIPVDDTLSKEGGMLGVAGNKYATRPEVAAVSDVADAAWRMARGGGSWLSPARTLEEAIASVPAAMRAEGFKIDYCPLQSQVWEVEITSSAQDDGEVGITIGRDAYSANVTIGDSAQSIALALAIVLSGKSAGSGTVQAWASNRTVIVRIDDSDAAYPVTRLNINVAGMRIVNTAPYVDGLTLTYQYHSDNLEGWTHVGNWEQVISETEWN